MYVDNLICKMMRERNFTFKSNSQEKNGGNILNDHESIYNDAHTNSIREPR